MANIAKRGSVILMAKFRELYPLPHPQSLAVLISVDPMHVPMRPVDHQAIYL